MFCGSRVDFTAAQFSGGVVSFAGADSPNRETFYGAYFDGGRVDFTGAKFSGADVDFSQLTTWTHPPEFDWDGTPPAGVKLPARPSASPPDSTSGEADTPMAAGS